jgi:secreted trypsin-like serine protease
LKVRGGSEAGHTRRSRARYMLAMVLALVLGLGVAVPVFAAEEDQELQPNIVGGTAVPDGKYRFMTAVRDVRHGNTVYEQQFCGGTLIDRNSVLTAAHCVEGRRASVLRATVGITALNKRQGQTRSVEKIFRHPKYTSAAVSFRYDAAVLKLSRRIKNIPSIKILPSTNNALERPGRTATIAGWGSTVKQPPDGGNEPNFPARMREAQVPIVSDDTAKDVYGVSYAPALMVAAGREGKDTCQGDSGGPIFARTSTATYQIGITSFGAGCGSRGYPGVYAEANSENIRPFIYRAAGK